MTQLRARILASFGVALLVIVTGWVGTATVSVSVAARDRLDAARTRLDARDALERRVLAARAALLGYLVTEDPAYLPAYTSFERDADPGQELIALLEDAAPAAVASLQATLRGEQASLASTMHFIAIGDRTSATALVRTESARTGAQRLHDELGRIMRHDVDERAHLRARLTRALRAGRIVVLGGSLLAFALAVMVNVSLMRALREREASQQIVLAQTEQLRRQTDVLLEHDKQLGEQLVAHQQLTSALQRSNEDLDRFAYATSHDLKAPLRGIMNIANWVEEDLGEQAAPEVKRNLGLLRSRAQRLEALIEGILAYSRAGRVHDKPEVVDVDALVCEIVELMALPSQCSVEARDLPRLLTERVPLQQVLMNLIQNAIRHGCPDEHGRVEVSGEPGGADRWRFLVRDRGPGIAEQFHDRIFGIFQSLAPRDVVEGAGIGLAVVKRLVESRGGRVGVESQLGAGATFYFTWPGQAA